MKTKITFRYKILLRFVSVDGDFIITVSNIYELKVYRSINLYVKM